MSGRLVGEVYDHARRLGAAGVTRNAITALAVVAEGCRDNRIGRAPLDRVADALLSSERTATRALTELRDRGLVHVVQRGGGRSRPGVRTVYRMVDLARWPADSPATDDPGDTQVATRSDPLDNSGPTEEPSTRQPGGDPIAADGDRIADPVDKTARSGRHLDGDQPVVPVTTPGGTTDVTPRRARPPSTAPPPPFEPSPAGAGSLCGQPGCRDPEPCRGCARVRQEREDAERAAAAEREYQVRQEHLAAQRELTAWLANQPTAPSQVALEAKREIREILEDAKAARPTRWPTSGSRPSPQRGGRHRAPDPPMPAAGGSDRPAPARPADGGRCAVEDRSGATAEADPERMVS